MSFKIFLCLALTLFQAKNSLLFKQSLFVKIQNQDGVKLEKDLIEYIEEGKNSMKLNSIGNSEIQKKAIMFLGLTGTGKTTLVNYLGGIPLVCAREDGKWIIKLENENITLPGGFKIGHSLSTSETIFPAVYSPPTKDFSYVDNPGFTDTRGIEIEIANSFFRVFGTEKSTEMKFLLLVDYQDLEKKGQEFRETIQRFSDILGVFDDDYNIKSFSKSVGIIVSRVDNDGETDDQKKDWCRSKLHDNIKAGTAAATIKPNQELVFSEILINSQIEIFSNPKSQQKLDDVQKNQINFLINKLKYFNKETAKFRARIAPTYIPTLFSYVEELQQDQFKQDFEEIMNKNLNEYVSREIDKSFVIEDIKNAQTVLNNVLLKSSQTSSFIDFVNILDSNLINKSQKDILLDKKFLLDFFINLLPDEFQKRLSGDKNYLNDFELEGKIRNQIDYLNKMAQQDISIVNDVMTVQSCFLNTSEIEILLNTYATIKSIVLILCQSIYFDASLNLRGYNSFTVIAPKWNISERTLINIDLSAFSNEQILPQAAHSSIPGAAGNEGIPGRPGKNGGHFYGFGNKFLNLGEFFIYFYIIIINLFENIF